MPPHAGKCYMTKKLTCFIIDFHMVIKSSELDIQHFQFLVLLPSSLDTHIIQKELCNNHHATLTHTF